MTHIEVVEGGKITSKYIPDTCDTCGKFLTKHGECNSCGDVRCDGCGDMVSDPSECAICNPEGTLQAVEDQIKECQNDEEVKSCSECKQNQRCWMLDEKHDLEAEINRRKK